LLNSINKKGRSARRNAKIGSRSSNKLNNDDAGSAAAGLISNKNNKLTSLFIEA
jgi:hypothetical protein